MICLCYVCSADFVTLSTAWKNGLPAFVVKAKFTMNPLTLKVLVTTIDALGHFKK